MGQQCCRVERESLEIDEEDVSWLVALAATWVLGAELCPDSAMHPWSPADASQVQLWDFWCDVDPTEFFWLGDKVLTPICDGPIAGWAPAAPRAALGTATAGASVESLAFPPGDGGHWGQFPSHGCEWHL